MVLKFRENCYLQIICHDLKSINGSKLCQELFCSLYNLYVSQYRWFCICEFGEKIVKLICCSLTVCDLYSSLAEPAVLLPTSSTFQPIFCIPDRGPDHHWCWTLRRGILQLPGPQHCWQCHHQGFARGHWWWATFILNTVSTYSKPSKGIRGTLKENLTG